MIYIWFTYKVLYYNIFFFIKISIVPIYMYLYKYRFTLHLPWFDLSFPVQSQMRSALSSGPDAPRAFNATDAGRSHLRLRTSTCVPPVSRSIIISILRYPAWKLPCWCVLENSTSITLPRSQSRAGIPNRLVIMKKINFSLSSKFWWTEDICPRTECRKL